MDVPKRSIGYCVRDGGDKIYGEGAIRATRFDLDRFG